MSSQDWATLLIIAFGFVAGSLSIQVQRYTSRLDKMWSETIRHGITMPDTMRRLERTQAAIVTLSENVASLGVMVATHHAWHEGTEGSPRNRGR